MATKANTKYSVKVVYNKDYDTEGKYATLPNYTGTFSKVSETASTTELKAFADALMSLTIYRGAPYKVQLVDTSTLVA